MNLLGIPAQVTTPGPGNALDVTLFQSTILTAQTNPATTPPGLLVTLKYPVTGSEDLTIPLGGIWSIQLQMQGNFLPGLQATVTPPVGVAIAPPSGTVNGSIQANLDAQAADPTSPLILIGQAVESTHP